jgi:AmmeMemoRadiSam system protein B
MCGTVGAHRQSTEAMMKSVRQPAVAGAFYPSRRDDLATQIRTMLSAAPTRGAAKPAPKAIVAPHAGYIYSGPIAASAYALLEPLRTAIRRVVLLGPAHRVYFRGLALPDNDALATPLGQVAVDAEAAAKAEKLPQVTTSAEAHALEHSLEVQLPFLQTVLDEWTVVPFAVGDATPGQVAEVLDLLWGGSETLIVVSSDLSHYLPYGKAQAVDRSTADAILKLNYDVLPEQACGGIPVNGLALVGRKRGLTAELLDLRNSGDTAGDRHQVVGYGAFAFYEPAVH